MVSSTSQASRAGRGDLVAPGLASTSPGGASVEPLSSAESQVGTNGLFPPYYL